MISIPIEPISCLGLFRWAPLDQGRMVRDGAGSESELGQYDILVSFSGPLAWLVMTVESNDDVDNGRSPPYGATGPNINEIHRDNFFFFCYI